MPRTLGALRRHPGDPDAIYAHAQSAFWSGNGALDRGDVDEAGRRWVEYLRRAEDLRRIEGRTRRSLMELGYANGNLCNLKLRKRTDVPGALVHCRAALDFVRQALAAPRAEGDLPDSDIRTALANRFAWFADALDESRRFDEAVQSRVQERALIDEALRLNPEDANLRDRAVASVIGLGKIAVARGEPGEGIARFEQAIAEFDRLLADFPDNMIIFWERFRVTVLVAETRIAAGDQRWRANCAAASAMLDQDAVRHPGGSAPQNLRDYFNKTCTRVGSPTKGKMP